MAYGRVMAVALALTNITYARTCLETDAFITPKAENKVEPHIGNHLLNLEAVLDADTNEADDESGQMDNHAHPGEIVTTKDIDNYFNLQITTKMYIGSQ